MGVSCPCSPVENVRGAPGRSLARPPRCRPARTPSEARTAACAAPRRRPGCGVPRPGPPLRFVEVAGPARPCAGAAPTSRWKWGRRTGRFRRPHAGGGDSSNGRQPLRPTRNHRRAPAARTGAVTFTASGCGWAPPRRRLKKAAARHRQRRRARLQARAGLVEECAMTGSPLPGAATASVKG